MTIIPVIDYYEDGQKEYEGYYNGTTHHRLDGPARQYWDVNGNTVFEQWLINGNALKNKELEEYKNWLVDHKLLGKPETEWTDEEMVLWKLTWNN